MPFIFKINVSWKKGDLKSTNISNIFNIFFIFYRNVFALGFLYAILTENVGNNLKKNIGSCLGNPTTKNHFCHIRRAVHWLSWQTNTLFNHLEVLKVNYYDIFHQRNLGNILISGPIAITF